MEQLLVKTINDFNNFKFNMISRRFATQHKFNKKVTIFAVLTTMLFVLNDVEKNKLQTQITELQKEVEKLKGE